MIDYEVINEFKKRKKRQIMLAISIAPLFLLRIFKAEIRQLDFLNDDLVGIALIIFIGSALILSFLNWRCPSCNAYLGRELGINHCKKCGVQLAE